MQFTISVYDDNSNCKVCGAHASEHHLDGCEIGALRERLTLEAQRVFANGERATAAEYALRYIIEKLQHHHTSRPGISEIIKSAKRLYKDSGGTTLFAPDAATPSASEGQGDNTPRR